jgi:phosphatidylglycerol---prolipoprotein diacylglyceryl transferase
MHPILFKIGSVTVYTYGFCIAVGAILGFYYMYREGKKRYGISFDQSNNLFILLILAGIIGGKLFMIFEDPSYYFSNPKKLISGSGFVFYGSLLLTIPVMLWYFKKIKAPVLGMLDVMAIVTCIVHGCGRIGCFMAGCCYGIPTDSFIGVIFSDPYCQAEPLNTPLHPTQLYEATMIFGIMTFLLIRQAQKKFEGQIFLSYLMLYAFGRGIIELLRGDLQRGFVIEGILSNSQFISLIMIAIALYFYVRLKRISTLSSK